MDIVERLRNPVPNDSFEREAADEIEQLRAENARLRELLQEIYDWTEHKHTIWARATAEALATKETTK